MFLSNEVKCQILANFNADGFVLISDFFSKNEIETINSNLRRVCNELLHNIPDHEVFYENNGNSSMIKQISSLEQHDFFFNNLLTSSNLIELSALLLNDTIIPKNLAYFNKPALIGKATPPHQDGYYFKIHPPLALTVWVALESSDEENGNVKYVKGSHLKGMRPHGKSETFGFSQQILDFGTEEDISKEISLQLKPGDILVHHPLTIHRADRNFSKVRSRESLGLVYYGKSAQEDTILLNQYHEELISRRK
ncbi:MAG: phytanoyl-CoA dioxygenase family protein [Sphingobacterium thalpophilum]